MAIAVGRGTPIPEPPPTFRRPAPNAHQREVAALGDELAETRGYRAFHVSDALDPRHGFPQAVYAKNGRMVVAEYLGPNQKPSENQSFWAEAFSGIEARSNGILRYCSVNAASWDQLVEALS